MPTSTEFVSLKASAGTDRRCICSGNYRNYNSCRKQGDVSLFAKSHPAA
jgi:hypothetical protein